MAEFYSARGWEIPPLPWTRLICHRRSHSFSKMEIIEGVSLNRTVLQQQLKDSQAPSNIKNFLTNLSQKVTCISITRSGFEGLVSCVIACQSGLLPKYNINTHMGRYFCRNGKLDGVKSK